MRTMRPVNPFEVIEQQLRLSTEAQLEEVTNETDSLDALTSAVRTVVKNMPPCKVKNESLHLLGAWLQRRRDLTATGNTVMRPISKAEVVRSVFKQLQTTNPDIKLDAQRPPSPQTCLSIAARPGLSASDADMFRNMHAYLQDYCPSILASPPPKPNPKPKETEPSAPAALDTVLGLRAVPVAVSHTEQTHTRPTLSSSFVPEDVSSKECKIVKRNLNPVFRLSKRQDETARRMDEYGPDVLKQIMAMLPLQASFRRPLKPDESPDGFVVGAYLSDENYTVEFRFSYHATKETCAFTQFREKAIARSPPVVSRDHTVFSDQPAMLYVRKSPADPWRRLHALMPVSVLHFLDDMALRQFVARDISSRSSSSMETESAQ